MLHNFLKNICVIFVVWQASSLDVKADILSQKDRSKATIYKDPLPKNHSPSAKQYWVCSSLSKEKIKVACDDLGIHDLEGPKEELQIALQDNFKLYSYGLRHGITRRECRRIQKQINKLISISHHVCLRGSLVNKDGDAVSEYSTWVFDEIKTERANLCEFNFCED